MSYDNQKSYNNQKTRTNPDWANPIRFTYTNYRNETRRCRAVPIRIWYGSADLHIEPQWFMKAMDLNDDDSHRGVRDFALKDCDFTSV